MAMGGPTPTTEVDLVPLLVSEVFCPVLDPKTKMRWEEVFGLLLVLIDNRCHLPDNFLGILGLLFIYTFSEITAIKLKSSKITLMLIKSELVTHFYFTTVYLCFISFFSC